MLAQRIQRLELLVEVGEEGAQFLERVPSMLALPRKLAVVCEMHEAPDDGERVPRHGIGNEWPPRICRRGAWCELY